MIIKKLLIFAILHVFQANSMAFHAYVASSDKPLEASLGKNTPGGFSVQLEHSLTFDDTWCVQLVSCMLETDENQSIYICSNLCKESIVGNSAAPVLARTNQSHTHPVNVKPGTYQEIVIFLLNEKLNHLPLYQAAPSKFVLHFAKTF